jgi:uncharacterized protein YuzE
VKINYTEPRSGGGGDALTVVFKSDAAYDESAEIAEGVHAHYDHDGNVTAIEFYEEASRKVDLSRLDISGLSLKAREAHFA